MHLLRTLFCAALCLAATEGFAADDKIIKVLPHLLDKEGRHTLSPSLYERDAYQSRLRNNPETISALRFDVQWKSKAAKGETLKLKIEARGRKAGSKLKVLEAEVKDRGFFSTWSKIPLDSKGYAELGGIGAWRVTLWRDGKQVAKQQSFLW